MTFNEMERPFQHLQTTRTKEIKMSISIQKVENFPEISRSGRVSEELQMIIDALNESVKTGEKFCITGIEKGKAYNSMQQRIRAQAKKLGFNIVIRFDADDSKLYFKATQDTNAMTSVTANAVPSVTPKEKTKASK